MNSQERELHVCESVYRSNLTYFLKNHPQLAKRIMSHTNPKYQLGFDDNGDINIWCLQKWLYDSPPISFALSQVKKAINQPEVMQLNPGTEKANLTEQRFLHQWYLEQIRTLGQGTPSTQNQQHAFRPSIVFLGVGLGYHIPMVLSEVTTRAIFIYEPEFDFFYCSLYQIDYNTIAANSKTHVHFCIGESIQDLATAMTHHYLPYHCFNAVKIQLIKHYNGQKLHEAYHDLGRHYGRFFDHYGFAEDECLGLSQFVNKLERSINLLQKTPPILTERPVIVVGSGPSIDQQLDFLKSVRGQVCMISCSSSLEILYRAGICPDFHVESERLHLMVDYFNNFPDKAYLSEITLLTLHPTHPNLGTYFKTAVEGFRFGDTGFVLWQEYINQKEIGLECCGPTSGNAAIAFAVRLGFKNICLMGLDLGQKSDDNHHSKMTLYYTSKDRKRQTIESSHEVKGNFGGQVRTTILLDKARFSLELLIQKNPQIQCFNMSDGAAIHGAIPLSDTEFMKQWPHSVLYPRDFPLSPITSGTNNHQLSVMQQAYDTILEQFLDHARSLTIPSPPTTLDEWYEFLHQSSDALQACLGRTHETPNLVKGSFVTLQTSVATVACHAHKQGRLHLISEHIACLWNSYIEIVPQFCIEIRGLNDEQRLLLLKSKLDLLKPIVLRN